MPGYDLLLYMFSPSYILDPVLEPYFAGETFLFVEQAVTFSEALEFCESDGGQLVVSTSDEVNYYAHYVSIEAPLKWIGAQITYSSDGYELSWADNSSNLDEFFNPGQPSNANGNESCIAMGKLSNVSSFQLGFFWNDVACDTKLPFVCQYETKSKLACRADFFADIT